MPFSTNYIATIEEGEGEGEGDIYTHMPTFVVEPYIDASGLMYLAKEMALYI